MQSNRFQVNNFLVISFLFIIFAGAIYVWLKGDLKYSTIENRELAQMPKMSLKKLTSGEYSKEFELYFNDQFPGRLKLIEANATINKDLLGQNVVKDVYVADNGLLLSTVPKQTKESAKVIANRINKFALQASKLGVTTYFSLAPNKSVTFEDQFPSYFPSYGNEASDYLFSYIDPIAHPLDLRITMNKHKNEPNLYPFTDHHWKAKAAFYSYQTIINTIYMNSNEVGKALNADDFIWKEEGLPFYGSDARKTTRANVTKTDTITVVNSKGKQDLNVCYNAICNRGLYAEEPLKNASLYTNRYVTYMGGDHPETAIYNDKVKNRKLLIIKDSYANASIQFFVNHYKETRVLDLRYYNKMPIIDYIKKYKIDDVVIINNVNSIYVTPTLTNFEHPGQGENQ
ncbi:DHHW family protein [Gottfriedia acidiceleris]|uniref:DHHW family protein n=1 Tax=Gottfriedia acidiceleris TaxID=371036 RepID=UPI002F25F2DE